MNQEVNILMDNFLGPCHWWRISYLIGLAMPREEGGQYCHLSSLDVSARYEVSHESFNYILGVSNALAISVVTEGVAGACFSLKWLELFFHVCYRFSELTHSIFAVVLSFNAPNTNLQLPCH